MTRRPRSDVPLAELEPAQRLESGLLRQEILAPAAASRR